jgi:hypothetical protein
VCVPEDTWLYGLGNWGRSSTTNGRAGIASEARIFWPQSLRGRMALCSMRTRTT